MRQNKKQINKNNHYGEEKNGKIKLFICLRLNSLKAKPNTVIHNFNFTKYKTNKV